MFLLDSNIIIYSYLDEYRYLRKLFVKDNAFVSEISRVEVLGYHKLKAAEATYFKDVFELIPSLIPNKKIFDKAISFRKKYNMKLGDSLIAGTATIYNLAIYTRNTQDFEKIKGVAYENPIE